MGMTAPSGDLGPRNRLHVFVLSWTGRHANSLEIAGAIGPYADRLTLLYSDCDEDLTLQAPCPTIKTPNDWYFGGKFKACLDACAAETMLVITGDVSCRDWPALVGKCRTAFTRHPTIGVWSPLIDYTPWHLGRTLISRLADSPLCMVAQTDSIVFALGRPVIARLQGMRYQANTYGWGIDWAAVAFCYANGLCAVVDDSIAVSHPRETGYDVFACPAQMEEFLRQLDPGETRQYLALQAHVGGQAAAVP